MAALGGGVGLTIDFFASNLALGLALLATLGGAAARNRRLVAEPLKSGQRGWRVVARTGYGGLVALLVWGTLVDSWRKLLGEAVDSGARFASQRLVQDPVPESIRSVTVLLLLVTLSALAPLVGRFVGGYGLQVAMVVIGATSFFLLFTLRQRLDSMLVTMDQLPALFSFAMAVTIVFLALDYAANVGLLVLTFLALLGLAAIPATFVLDRRHWRDPPLEGSADEFYGALSSSVAARHAEARRKSRSNGRPESNEPLDPPATQHASQRPGHR